MTVLHRAIAYRLERTHTPDDQHQPEVTVFFEAPTVTAASSLLRLLALTWGCQPPDVEFYNLETEYDLIQGVYAPSAKNGAANEMGDAALLVTGWYQGPLFCRADRTLMLVRPLTLKRLLRARVLAVSLHATQRAAAGEFSGLGQAEAAARAVRIRERAEVIGSSSMGGLC